MDNNIDPEIEDLVKRFFSAANKKSVEYFDADDYVDIIEYFIDRKMIKFAKQALNEAIGLYPEDEIVLDKKAELLLIDNKTKDALLVLQAIDNPKMSMTFGMLGECYIKSGQMKNAVQAFNSLIDTSVPDDLLNTFIDVTQLFNENEMYGGAVEFADRGLEMFPNDIELSKEKALALTALGKSEKAIELYNKLIDQDPYNIEAWYTLANIYLSSDNRQEAVRCFDYILAIDNNPQVAYLKGQCLMHLERLDEAIEAMLLSLKWDDSNYYVKHDLANAYTQNDQMEKAVPIFKDIIDNFPVIPEAFIGYATCLFETTGKIEEALDVLNQAESIFPDNPGVLFFLAHYEIQEADVIENPEVILRNIERLKVCLESSPDNPMFNNAIGLAYFMLRQFNKAYKHFTIAARNGIDVNNIYIYISASAWLMGNKTLFAQYYREAKSRYSNTDSILSALCPEALDYINTLPK